MNPVNSVIICRFACSAQNAKREKAHDCLFKLVMEKEKEK